MVCSDHILAHKVTRARESLKPRDGGKCVLCVCEYRRENGELKIVNVRRNVVFEWCTQLASEKKELNTRKTESKNINKKYEYA